MTNGRILVVMPDDNIRNMLRIYLSGKGYEVAAASSGAEGLTAYEAGFKPDVMLLFNDGHTIWEGINDENMILLERFNKPAQIIFLYRIRDERKIRWADLMSEPLFGSIQIPFDIEDLRFSVEQIIAKARKP